MAHKRWPCSRLSELLSVKVSLADCRAYRTHPDSSPRSGLSAPSVRHRQLPPCATYPFSCCGRSPLVCPHPLSWIHSPVPLRVCLACIALKLPVLSSWVRSIHCGTAAVALAVVVSSGTGGGDLACVCFCCGSIFVSVTSLAVGQTTPGCRFSTISLGSFQDITLVLSFTPQSYCLRAERQGRGSSCFLEKVLYASLRCS